MFCKRETKKTETVKCSECKCLLEIQDAVFVTGGQGYKTYYCRAHRKPYDRVCWVAISCKEAKCIGGHMGYSSGQSYHYRIAYYKTIPEYYVEVTAEGKEIKQKSK